MYHPHAYGDKIQITLVCQRVVKSSPRVWGQDILPYEKAWNMRIIPTRMGTSDPMFFFNFRLRDHPHAYGDKLTLLYRPLQNLGSSPRVWGQGV